MMNHESPETVALLMQQRALYAQIADALSQLEQITKALSPPPQKPEPYNRVAWRNDLERRLKERSRK